MTGAPDGGSAHFGGGGQSVRNRERPSPVERIQTQRTVVNMGKGVGSPNLSTCMDAKRDETKGGAFEEIQTNAGSGTAHEFLAQHLHFGRGWRSKTRFRRPQRTLN